jgi:hypothetical protein
MNHMIWRGGGGEERRAEGGGQSPFIFGGDFFLCFKTTNTINYRKMNNTYVLLNVRLG